MLAFRYLFILLFSGCLYLLLVGSAFATSGSTASGYGIISRAMGGTGVAHQVGALTAAVNPAGIVFVGRKGTIGVGLFAPVRRYSATTGMGIFQVAPGTHFSRTPIFVVPNGGYVSPFSDGRGAWSISTYANGGLNANYSGGIPGSTIGGGSNGVYSGGEAKVDLLQIFTNMAVGWKLTPDLSIGASLIAVVQAFDAKGFSAFGPFSTNPGRLTNKGEQFSYGVGGRIGVLVKPTKIIAVGASYQPEIPMTNFTAYSGLLPGSGSFNIPPRGVVGIAITPIKQLDVNFDYQYIWYSSVAAYSNPFVCTLGGPGKCLGLKGGSGLGWANASVFKIGLQWFINKLWTVRVGYLHSSEVVRPSQVLFDIIAPAVVTSHFTAGFTRYIGKHMAVSMAAMYAPPKTVSGPNPFNPTQMISLTMDQYYAGVSWSCT